MQVIWNISFLRIAHYDLQDAEKAVDAGADGIIVSNHGICIPTYFKFRC